MKNYFITCYADFLGFSLGLFLEDKDGLTLLKLFYSDTVSNKKIFEAIDSFHPFIKEKNIRYSEISLYLNDNKILHKYLKEKIHNFKTIQILDFDLEETLYILSSAINDGTFAITKEVASHNIVREIKNLDLQVTNHKVYSLLIAVKKIQKANGVMMFCFTTGQKINPNSRAYREKYPFGKPDVRSVKDLWR
ncbi:hypothetical protein FEK30_01120 (plasmid) [Picosynechococcus sp. PCC 11901]|uniref:hypothetical protein n=1 Tax=Picosynechococcus sp. PCC 11901 TaxID=2579791 RepID=UPI0010FBD2BE|nr:hypothetical protein [Picosynechococcus sp. PCC 11901]QCS48145.1 hypothetical protein FEK30_01120 [Picosynechococcus sp. PCC 11901]